MVDIKELTSAEKIKAFRKLKKEKLIEMLIQANTLLAAATSEKREGSEYQITYVPNKHPHCCPVCGGNGLVPAGFYNQATGKENSISDLRSEMCRTCNGHGFIMA